MQTRRTAYPERRAPTALPAVGGILRSAIGDPALASAAADCYAEYAARPGARRTVSCPRLAAAGAMLYLALCLGDARMARRALGLAPAARRFEAPRVAAGIRRALGG